MANRQRLTRVVGDIYPSASILGVDLSPIQPTWVPPNVKFIVDDVESPWLHPRNSFDFIHSRHTVMAFKDWPKLLDNVYTYVTTTYFLFFDIYSGSVIADMIRQSSETWRMVRDARNTSFSTMS
jgi:hypothetical protein